MTTVVIIGMAVVIVVPRLRVSPRSHVRHAAEQLVNDLELIRTRALATKSMVRLDCNTGGASYVAYLDDNQDDVINATTAEAQAMRGFGQRSLANGVVFGLGSVPRLPGDTLSGPVTFAAECYSLHNNCSDCQFFARQGGVYSWPTKNITLSCSCSYIVIRLWHDSGKRVTTEGNGSLRKWESRSAR